MKFNPVDKSITHIGPNLGYDWGKWHEGAITDSGIIYCPPRDSCLRGILSKINTNTDKVTELDVNLLPKRGEDMWESCAATLDGCIYFMPSNDRHIMKLDPNVNEAMSSVGDDLGYCERKYTGTVVGIDGCVFGYLDITIVSSNTIQSIILLLKKILNVVVMVLWEEMDVFMRSLIILS